MSDCPDCENSGFIEDYAEIYDESGRDVGYWYRFDCKNWRHQVGPSLEEIGAAIRDGRELPKHYRKEIK